MKILLTGANGYIGKRLLPVLLEEGHEVYAVVRDRDRFMPGSLPGGPLHILEMDFLEENSADQLPGDLDAAYYLIHSMRSGLDDFNELESLSAKRFVKLLDKTAARQIIYLGGISNAGKLSKHLESRKTVETILSAARASLTILRAGIIVGSGSASFEIIRDLVEKLPVMVTPRWLNTRCQPIAVRNVIQYLTGVLQNPVCMGRTFDIGGPEILTYKEMLLQFASVRKLRRYIFTIPVMTPRLSSYWLYFVTATSYNLAVNLVNSMKVEVICQENTIREIIDVPLIDYRRSIELAFARIEQNLVLSSWKDAMISGQKYLDLDKWIQVPQFGCYQDKQIRELKNDREQVLSNIWSIGGERGWYHASWLWGLRGFLDKVVGGGRAPQGKDQPGKHSQRGCPRFLAGGLREQGNAAPPAVCRDETPRRGLA